VFFVANASESPISPPPLRQGSSLYKYYVAVARLLHAARVRRLRPFRPAARGLLSSNHKSLIRERRWRFVYTTGGRKGEWGLYFPPPYSRSAFKLKRLLYICTHMHVSCLPSAQNRSDQAFVALVRTLPWHPSCACSWTCSNGTGFCWGLLYFMKKPCHGSQFLLNPVIVRRAGCFTTSIISSGVPSSNARALVYPILRHPTSLTCTH